MAKATKSVIESFYSTITPDANAGASEGPRLLPVKASDGAPRKALYLMEFHNLEVKRSGPNAATPNFPYINARLAVVEPDCFENRGFFTMFYIPMPKADADAKEQARITANTARVMGQIDRILGEGAALEALGEVEDVESLADALSDLVADLEGERAVVEVGVQKPNEKQIALGYTEPKNVVKQYFGADTWEGE